MVNASRLLAAVLAGSDELSRVASASATAFGVALNSIAQSARTRATARVVRPRFPNPSYRTPDESGRATTGPWTAARLRQVLHESLQGERVIVVANREPRIHDYN